MGTKPWAARIQNGRTPKWALNIERGKKKIGVKTKIIDERQDDKLTNTELVKLIKSTSYSREV